MTTQDTTIATTQETGLVLDSANETTMANMVGHAIRHHFDGDPKAVRAMQLAVVHAANHSPKLWECDTESMMVAAMTCADLNLYPSGANSFVHMVPFKGKVQVIIGYRGLMELARRAGVHITEDKVVYQDEIDRDLFAAQFAPFQLRHDWGPPADDRPKDGSTVMAAYASCVVDGQRVGVLLDRADIEARKAMAQGTSRADSPWVKTYAAMARKSAIRALLTSGKVPLQAEVMSALAASDPSHPASPAQARPKAIDVQPEPAANPTEAAERALGGGDQGAEQW